MQKSKFESNHSVINVEDVRTKYIAILSKVCKLMKWRGVKMTSDDEVFINKSEIELNNEDAHKIIEVLRTAAGPYFNNCVCVCLVRCKFE